MPLDLQKVWEGGSGDDREPGDRPLTRIQLVRRWVDGRGVMGLLKYAAGSAAVVALACCHSTAYAQSNSDQLPPVVVNPNDPPKPARQIRRDRDRSRASPVRPAAKNPPRPTRAAPGGGGNGRQGARTHQPPGEINQRGQRRDAG